MQGICRRTAAPIVLRGAANVPRFFYSQHLKTNSNRPSGVFPVIHAVVVVSGSYAAHGCWRSRV